MCSYCPYYPKIKMGCYYCQLSNYVLCDVNIFNKNNSMMKKVDVVIVSIIL